MALHPQKVGYGISVGAHLMLVAAALFGFLTSSPKPEEGESVPVEIVSDEPAQSTRGERRGQQTPTPQRVVDRQTPDERPTPDDPNTPVARERVQNVQLPPPPTPRPPVPQPAPEAAEPPPPAPRPAQVAAVQPPTPPPPQPQPRPTPSAQEVREDEAAREAEIQAQKKREEEQQRREEQRVAEQRRRDEQRRQEQQRVAEQREREQREAREKQEREQRERQVREARERREREQRETAERATHMVGVRAAGAAGRDDEVGVGPVECGDRGRAVVADPDAGRRRGAEHPEHARDRRPEAVAHAPGFGDTREHDLIAREDRRHAGEPRDLEHVERRRGREGEVGGGESGPDLDERVAGARLLGGRTDVIAAIRPSSRSREPSTWAFSLRTTVSAPAGSRPPVTIAEAVPGVSGPAVPSSQGPPPRTAQPSIAAEA